MQQHRRLAAILFADIAGFTAVMQRNEEIAVSEIKLYKSVLKNALHKSGGKVLNNYGDGDLCVFDSATDALKAAISIQSQLKKSSPAVPLRIGLHIGEVWMENETVLGDGVNIASRIQSIANENAILFSFDFYQQIKNHPGFDSKLIGSFEFKNVDQPVVVYALAKEGFTVPVKSEVTGKLKADSLLKIPGRLMLGLVMILILSALFWWKKSRVPALAKGENTIAILPFQNPGDNKEDNEPFCIGIRLELQRKLERIGGLTTISAQSVEKYQDTKLSVQHISRELGGVKYLVKGTVQRNGKQVKVFVSLIDAPGGVQLWSEAFPGEMVDVFAVQDSIARQIADVLMVKISPGENSALKKLPTQNADALERYNEALSFYVKLVYALHPAWPASLTDNPSLYSDYRNILALCDKALEADPAMEDALLLKARTMLFRHRHFNSGPEIADSIRNLCRQALNLKTPSQEAYVVLSQLQPSGSKLKPDPVTGMMPLQLLEKALSINPNNFEVNRELGNYYALKEPDPEKSIHHFNLALRINPLSVWTAGIYLDFAVPYWNVYDYPVAEYYLKKSLELSANSSVSCEAMNRLCMIYLQTRKPDSLFRYSGLLISQGDINGLYFNAEAYCLFKDSCQKAGKIYDEVWKRFPDRIKENRMGYALWKSGKKEEGLKHMNEALNAFRKFDSLGLQDFNNYEVAGIYAFLGEKEKAIEVLKNMDQDKCWNMGMLNFVKIDPLFNNLRNDPELNSIITRETDKRMRLREKIRQQEAEGSL